MSEDNLMPVNIVLLIEAKDEFLTRERNFIFLLTGMITDEVLGTFTWKELRHLQATMLFFSSI